MKSIILILVGVTTFVLKLLFTCIFRSCILAYFQAYQVFGTVDCLHTRISSYWIYGLRVSLEGLDIPSSKLKRHLSPWALLFLRISFNFIPNIILCTVLLDREKFSSSFENFSPRAFIRFFFSYKEALMNIVKTPWFFTITESSLAHHLF